MLRKRQEIRSRRRPGHSNSYCTVNSDDNAGGKPVARHSFPFSFIAQVAPIGNSRSIPNCGDMTSCVSINSHTRIRGQR